MTLPPRILFGAFDRHNFGDLLFPHLLAALLPGGGFEYAGLAARDLRAYGGHRVAPLGDRRRGHLIHAGGEILDCRAYEAAVMLLDPPAAARAIARYDGDPAAAEAWAAEQLGTARRLPYVAGREAVASPGRLIFSAVGGVEWAMLPAAAREEARTALAGADWVSVRDRVTRDALRADGIEAALCPDPAVMVRACFGELIVAHCQQGAVQALRQDFPQGYLACQFSADFADDTSLDALAAAFRRIARATGLGLALFRAGAAPWHDDLACYQRLLRRLPAGMARLFDSLNLWDICALIAASRGTLTSSLHGRIVAAAYGLPRVSLRAPQQNGRIDKLTAFAATWEPAGLTGSVAAEALEAAALDALDVPAAMLDAHAAQLREAFGAGLAAWIPLLGPPHGTRPPAR